jgi:hypothetical protein
VTGLVAGQVGVLLNPLVPAMACMLAASSTYWFKIVCGRLVNHPVEKSEGKEMRRKKLKKFDDISRSEYCRRE